MATVSTHVLDATDGSHAGGVAIRLVRTGEDAPLLTSRTDAGGRMSETVDISGADPETSYDLIFDTAAYWRARGRVPGRLAQVVLRLGMPDPDIAYHSPVIISPNGYSTWISEQSKEKATEVIEAKVAQLNLCFWENLLEHFGRNGFKLFQKIKPKKKAFIAAASGVPGFSYYLIFVKKEVRVDCFIMGPNKEDIKKRFDSLFAKRREIETRFGASLEWSRLDDKKFSKIGITKSVDSHDEENWEEIIDWFLENTRKLEIALKPAIKDISK